MPTRTRRTRGTAAETGVASHMLAWLGADELSLLTGWVPKGDLSSWARSCQAAAAAARVAFAPRPPPGLQIRDRRDRALGAQAVVQKHARDATLGDPQLKSSRSELCRDVSCEAALDFPADANNNDWLREGRTQNPSHKG